MIQCPQCMSRFSIVKNGFNRLRKQFYRCKNCSRQFVDPKLLVREKPDKQKDIKTEEMILRALERSNGIRSIAYILRISPHKILKTLTKVQLDLRPKLKKYKSVQIDELWSFVGKKSNKKWLIYAYSPENKEVLAFVVGKRDSSTVNKLYEKLKSFDVKIDEYCTDNWNSFAEVFKDANHKVGKAFTKAIEGINCLLRHRVSRLSRKTCCFSKTLKNHISAIGLVIQSINSGTAWSTFNPIF